MGVFVFGYGSLMWNPGFEHVRAAPALLTGWQRAWCVRSTFYRGCEDIPGYVLGLKSGGNCVGMLFELDEMSAGDTVALLDDREMRERGYVRQVLEVTRERDNVLAFVYTSDGMPDPCRDTFARAYRSAKGSAGGNREYIDRTCDFLKSFRVPQLWPSAETGIPAGALDFE